HGTKLSADVRRAGRGAHRGGREGRDRGDRGHRGLRRPGVRLDAWRSFARTLGPPEGPRAHRLSGPLTRRCGRKLPALRGRVARRAAWLFADAGRVTSAAPTSSGLMAHL